MEKKWWKEAVFKPLSTKIFPEFFASFSVSIL
ncbi:hypothetical protein JOD82_001559 [Paenibacillus sp. 1182]|jgi:hypothetical protein|nr:hypothetical protein [Paenibacillus sp. 1182]